MTRRQLTPEEVVEADAYFRQRWLALFGLAATPVKPAFLTPNPEAEAEAEAG
jgi:hypothetical protein